jgi:extradiol dioxygenase family protein
VFVDDTAAALFHHAFPVSDIDQASRFYGDVLGCRTARRSDERAVDFDFFGHHIIAHLVEGDDADLHRKASRGHNIAVRHFGVAVDWAQWESILERLRHAGVPFVVEPTVKHEGEPQEEAYVIVTDPAGNALEFKTFRDPRYLFTATAAS